MCNVQQTEIARLNQRIEDHESAFCGIIQALTEKDIKTAFLLATEALCPKDRPASAESGKQPDFSGSSYPDSDSGRMT